MNAFLQEKGRWLKRERLKLMRRLSANKRRWNSALNLREFWHGRVRLDSFPRMIQLGSTMACNLRCFFCVRTMEFVKEQHAKRRTRLEREIPPAVFEQVLAIMPYVEIFDLTPFGENFLYSNFDRLLETHARLGCSNITMTTAGTLITPQRAELIVRSGVQQVKISLEETQPGLYAGMRRGASLDSVIEGIRLLRQWKERTNSPTPRLTLAASYMQRNIERLPDMVRFAAEQGVPEIYVQMLELKYHDDAEVQKEELTFHIPLLRRMIAEGEAEAKRLGVQYVVTYPIAALLEAQSDSDPSYVRSSHFSGRSEEKMPTEVGTTYRPNPNPNANSAPENIRSSHFTGRLEETTPTEAGTTYGPAQSPRRHRRLIEKCTNPWWWAYIDENGLMWPCCWAKVQFGDLNRNSFMEVWNSDVAQDMRRRFLADDLPNYCRGQLCHVDIE